MKTVYHTTSKANGKIIAKNGWLVTAQGTNIYGRGIYFWENPEDAHSYGKKQYGDNNYDIVAEGIPILPNNSITYNHKKAESSIDIIANKLLKRGIDVIIIPNSYVKTSTLKTAKGKAYVWLVDLKQTLRQV